MLWSDCTWCWEYGHVASSILMVESYAQIFIPDCGGWHRERERERATEHREKGNGNTSCVFKAIFDLQTVFSSLIKFVSPIMPTADFLFYPLALWLTVLPALLHSVIGTPSSSVSVSAVPGAWVVLVSEVSARS